MDYYLPLWKYLFLIGSKCELNRRGFALRGIFAAGASVLPSSMVSEPAGGKFG